MRNRDSRIYDTKYSVKPGNNIDFCEVYAVVCLYYYVFLGMDKTGYPMPAVPQNYREKFSPLARSGIYKIMTFSEGDRYEPFDKIPKEEKSFEEVCEKSIERLSHLNYPRNKKNLMFEMPREILAYNEQEYRVYMMFVHKRLTFNSLAETVYDYLGKYLEYYESFGGGRESVLSSKKSLDRDFRDMFNGYFRKALFWEEEGMLPKKYIY